METEKKINKAVIKKSSEAIVREAKAKAARMIRGQIQIYDQTGVKELPLTYNLDSGQVVKKLARHNDILELPFGYIKYLNTHSISIFGFLEILGARIANPVSEF